MQSQHGRCCNFISRGEESEESSKGRSGQDTRLSGHRLCKLCVSVRVSCGTSAGCSLFRQILWNESSVLDTRSRKVGQLCIQCPRGNTTLEETARSETFSATRFHETPSWRGPKRFNCVVPLVFQKFPLFSPRVSRFFEIKISIDSEDLDRLGVKSRSLSITRDSANESLASYSRFPLARSFKTRTCVLAALEVVHCSQARETVAQSFLPCQVLATQSCL